MQIESKRLKMKFVVISDTHGHHRGLNLPAGDIIIHAGDFCHSEEMMVSNDFLADWSWRVKL